MELILWRHADAEDGTPDEERRLTAKGEKQAQRMAAWLKERLPKNAVVLVSSARRARETAQALTRKFETIREIGTAATPQSVLKAAGWPDAEGTVVVVGHQPTLGQTAALALTGAEAGWSLKKAGLWWLESRDRGDVIVRAVVSPDML
ncbi:MAG TPA: histidine phosphatase family protein [Gemmatimonadaceae bacterium]|nr:histidine phosphatase family protein [Gemmatimonadaceae bacterium]